MAAKAGFKDLLLKKGEKFALIGALGLLGLFLVWGVVGAAGADNPDKLSKDLDGKSSSVQAKISSTDGKPTELPDYAIPNTKKTDFTLVSAPEYQHIGKLFEPVAKPSQRREQPRVLTPVESQINYYGASYKAYDREFTFDKDGEVLSVKGGFLAEATTKEADREALKKMFDKMKNKPPVGAKPVKPKQLQAGSTAAGGPTAPGGPVIPGGPGASGGPGSTRPPGSGSSMPAGMFPGAAGSFASGNRSETKVVYRSIEDGTKLNLQPAVALYPIRMAVIQMSFPVKAQLEEIKQALRLRNLMEARLESSPTTISNRTGTGVAGTPATPLAPTTPFGSNFPGATSPGGTAAADNTSPAFAGLIVERLTIPEEGLPASLTKEQYESLWRPLEHQEKFFSRFTRYDAPFVKEEGYKPYFLRPEQGVSAPLPVLAEGFALNYPPDTTLGTIYSNYKRLEESKAAKKTDKDMLDRYKFGSTNPYATPPAAAGSFMGSFGDDNRPSGPNGPGGMSSSGMIRPPLGGMFPPGATNPAGGGDDTASPSNLNKLDVDHLLMRFLDVELEPGNTYQYRVKVQMKSPNFKNKENVSDTNMADIEVLESPWYELPQKLTVPQEAFLYAYSAKKYEESVVKIYEDSGKAEPIRKVAELQDVKDGKRAVVQVQQWMERLMLGNKEEPIGAWVQAEMPVAVGEFVGKKVPVELPLWRSAALHFVLPQGDAKTPIYPYWPKDTSKYPLPKVRVLDFRTKNVLVDFEGGHSSTRVGTQMLGEDSTADLLILREDGKLEVRSEAVDMVANVLPVPPTARAQRDQAWHEWLDRIRKLKDTESTSGLGSGPAPPGRPSGDGGGGGDKK